MSTGRHHNLARDTLRLYASFGAPVDRSGYGGREMLIFGMFVWNSTSNSYTDLTTYQTTHQIVKTGLPCSHRSGLQWARTPQSTCTHPLIESRSAPAPAEAHARTH
jgi:hypothetical protein